ncbi:helix-turn-helix transcriptional regulator [Paenibacillus lutrae]|uniref:WYL domain-containing protein n=1 Tax=Paenibacillus lutrae TaxID=2078573 RepID=A0A7X3FEA9_9BACL|nr:YafY family protein [Paenibacillus lutrae]MVO98064.1 WYL domain-containing protein [Paenibacillus lutrae]
MSKSKRLMELMMTVNQKRKFTVRELAEEFGVSQRTILRDLQELSELGVPLYSEVGPHGGYRVLRERLLPPIAFSEEEAVAIFFAIHALRHYSSLPFEAESHSALKKFYSHMPHDTRDRIDQMKNRVDFVTPFRQASSPHLSMLLTAAVQQQVIRIDYESRQRRSNRDIQPVGIYTRNGLWYCYAYCYPSAEYRVFRCDRIHSAVPSDLGAMDLREVHLENRDLPKPEGQDNLTVYAELTREGVLACEAEPWPEPQLHIRQDGTGWLEGEFAKNDLPYFAKFFIGLGKEAKVIQPPELLDCLRQHLADLMARYMD